MTQGSSVQPEFLTAWRPAEHTESCPGVEQGLIPSVTFTLEVLRAPEIRTECGDFTELVIGPVWSLRGYLL